MHCVSIEMTLHSFTVQFKLLFHARKCVRVCVIALLNVQPIFYRSDEEEKVQNKTEVELVFTHHYFTSAILVYAANAIH